MVGNITDQTGRQNGGPTKETIDEPLFVVAHKEGEPIALTVRIPLSPNGNGERIRRLALAMQQIRKHYPKKRFIVVVMQSEASSALTYNTFTEYGVIEG